MTSPADTLTANTALGEFVLERATAADQTALEALQHAAYAANRASLGVEPIPLLADYAERLRTCECWVHRASEDKTQLDAALMLETDRPDDILIWSVATRPGIQQRGSGHALLAAAETRARQLARSTIRLYTGAVLKHLVDWYTRNGYKTEYIEQLPDRTAVHMIKQLT